MSRNHPKAYVQLTRFPLIFTAWADVLAGYFIAEHDAAREAHSLDVALAVGVISCLYWSGMLLHDAFKYESAREHGRTQALPRGILSTTSAFATAILLVLVGAMAAVFVAKSAAVMALVVAVLLVVFAAITREVFFFSSLTMALCRGANVMLGMAFVHGSSFPVTRLTHLAPVLTLTAFVFLVTQISLEERGPRTEPLVVLTAAVVLILVAVTAFHFVTDLSDASWWGSLVMSAVVLATVLRILQVARRAVHERTGEAVEKLVIAGLVGSIVLDANLVAFAGIPRATIGVLFLLVPTYVMLRLFRILYPATRDAIE